jgi:hypothetical protein
MFSHMSDRFKRLFAVAAERRHEDYPASSANLADLDRRMRAIDHASRGYMLRSEPRAYSRGFALYEWKH